MSWVLKEPRKRKPYRMKNEEERRLERNIWIAQFGQSPVVKKKTITARNSFRFKKSNCYLKGYTMAAKTNIMWPQQLCKIQRAKTYWTLIKHEDGRYISVRTSDLIDWVYLILEWDFNNAKSYKADIRMFNARNKDAIDYRPDLLSYAASGEQYVTDREKHARTFPDKRKRMASTTTRKKSNDNEK